MKSILATEDPREPVGEFMHYYDHDVIVISVVKTETGYSHQMLVISDIFGGQEQTMIINGLAVTVVVGGESLDVLDELNGNQWRPRQGRISRHCRH